jgi:hypothetical protein
VSVPLPLALALLDAAAGVYPVDYAVRRERRADETGRLPAPAGELV